MLTLHSVPEHLCKQIIRLRHCNTLVSWPRRGYEDVWRDNFFSFIGRYVPLQVCTFQHELVPSLRQIWEDDEAPRIDHGHIISHWTLLEGIARKTGRNNGGNDERIGRAQRWRSDQQREELIDEARKTELSTARAKKTHMPSKEYIMREVVLSMIAEET